MAREKNKSPRPPVEEQEEMTVVILKYKGGGDTLRKGFDTVSQALAALGPPAPVSRKLLAARTEAQVLSNGGEVPQEDAIQDGDDELLNADNREDNSAELRQSGSPRKYSTPKFLSDLNLSPEGQRSWKEYALAKNPQTEADKYLFAAGWLTEHGGNDEFEINHIFTCFRAMEWKMPRDTSQPLRTLKKTKSLLEKLGKGRWKLTSLGLDQVRSFPRSAA